MSADERTVVGDYSFPAGAEPDEDLTYTIPFGDNDAEDLKWEGYVDVAHQYGVSDIKTEVVYTGQVNGVLTAAVKATIVTDDGGTFESLQAADEATNQVRDAEFVWAVAESRALKRAVKKAYNIKPVDADASDEPAPKKPDDVEYEDGHALADGYDDAQEATSVTDRGADVEGEVDW